MTPDEITQGASPAAGPVRLWRRWVLAAAVAAALLLALVIAVHRAEPEGASSEAQAEAETNRIADEAIAEDEAPHSAALAKGLTAAVALQRAIAGDARSRIESGQLAGPLQSVTCTAAAGGGSAAGRTPYRCTVRSDGVSYPFLAVADESTRQLVWCKVVEPAVAQAGPEVPVSMRCRR